MKTGLDIVIFGLSLSSAWGNGHATTYRALIRGLAQEGHRVLFLERDVPWYAAARDLPRPDFCRLEFYDSQAEAIAAHSAELRQADAVIVGSYVPDGAELIDRLIAVGPRRLCFYDIDTPVTLDALDAGERSCLRLDQMPGFDVYFSFSGGRALTVLERDYGVRRARALYCSVDPELYAVGPQEPRKTWALGYLGTYSPDRQPGLEQMLIEPARRLPDRRFVVAGARYPDGIDWPPNIDRIEHLPPPDHPAFYRQQEFTLNLTRAAMRRIGWSPSVRLFEAAASGTPIISDRWEGMDEIFPPDRAIVTAGSTREVIDMLTGTPAERRLSLAGAARATVLKGHTGRARAQELVADILGVPGGGRHEHGGLSDISLRGTAS